MDEFDLSKFILWARTNVELLREFETEALRLIQYNRTGGISEIREVLRWRRKCSHVGDILRINNAYSPLIARLLINKHPQLSKHLRCSTTAWDLHVPYILDNVVF